MKKIERKKMGIFWEILISSALLIILNFLFLPEDIGYHKVQINPFLLVVLLVVIRYGYRWGIFAVLIATIYYTFTPPFTIDQLFERLPQNALFLILMLIFGTIQEKNEMVISKLVDSLEQSKKSFKELSERLGVITYLKQEYEKRILTQTVTMTDLYDDVLHLQALHEEDLYSKILEMLKKYVDAEKSSLYLIENRTLLLKQIYGYTNGEKRAEHLFLDKLPFSLVARNNNSVTLNEMASKKTDESNLPVFAGPIRGDDGNIIGMLTVDSLDLIKFNMVNKRVFNKICEWASKAIGISKYNQVCENQIIIRPDTRIYKYEYLLIRLEEAMKISKKIGYKYALIYIRILGWKEMLPDKKASVIKLILVIIQQNIRDFDLLAHLKRENEFAVLMPVSDDYGIKNLERKLTDELLKFDIRPFENLERNLQIRFSVITDFKSYNFKEKMIEELRTIEGATLPDDLIITPFKARTI